MCDLLFYCACTHHELSESPFTVPWRHLEDRIASSQKPQKVHWRLEYLGKVYGQNCLVLTARILTVPPKQSWNIVVHIKAFNNHHSLVLASSRALHCMYRNFHFLTDVDRTLTQVHDGNIILTGFSSFVFSDITWVVRPNVLLCLYIP